MTEKQHTTYTVYNTETFEPFCEFDDMGLAIQQVKCQIKIDANCHDYHNIRWSFMRKEQFELLKVR